MKKVLVLLSVLLMFSFSFGALSWCGNSFIIANETWYTGSNTYEQPAGYFDGKNLGEISSLKLGGEVQSWDVEGDVVKLGYKFDSDDGTIGYVDLPYLKYESNNEWWQANPGETIDISGLSSGSHTVEVWFWARDNDRPADAYDNNSGSNFEASFTIPEGEVPVTLASFTAEALKGKVELAWVTESEAENSHFLVYRDGAVIGRVDGNGTTTETHAYSFVDDKVVPGVHEYALADVTYGGVEDMHDAVAVEVGATVEAVEFTLNSAYPNPFNPDTRIDYHLSRRINFRLGVYNLQGEKVADLFNGIQEAGSHTAIWNATGFPSGIYVVRMMSEGMLQTMKVVLMK